MRRCIMAALFMALFLLAGCGNHGINEDLIGIWVVDDAAARGTELQLNADGTGRRWALPGVTGEVFDWTATDTELRINRRNAAADEVANERWDFTLADGILRKESRQDRTLVRTFYQENALGHPDAALVGAWAWNDDLLFEYHFSADGTGLRGYTNHFEAFSWGMREGVIRMRFNDAPPPGYTRHQSWDVTLTGDALRLQNRISGQAFHYTRDMLIGIIDPAFIGRWVWEAYPLWRYHFEYDGTGTRGIPAHGTQQAQIDRIIWGVHNNELRILPSPLPALGQPQQRIVHLSALERWAFTLDNGVLALENLNDPEMVFVYVKE